MQRQIVVAPGECDYASYPVWISTGSAQVVWIGREHHCEIGARRVARDEQALWVATMCGGDLMSFHQCRRAIVQEIRKACFRVNAVIGNGDNNAAAGQSFT